MFCFCFSTYDLYDLGNLSDLSEILIVMERGFREVTWYLACRKCSVNYGSAIVQPLLLSPMSYFLDFKLKTVTYILKDCVE